MEEEEEEKLKFIILFYVDKNEEINFGLLLLRESLYALRPLFSAGWN